MVAEQSTRSPAGVCRHIASKSTALLISGCPLKLCCYPVHVSSLLAGGTRYVRWQLGLLQTLHQHVDKDQTVTLSGSSRAFCVVSTGYEPRGLFNVVEFVMNDKESSGSISLEHALQVSRRWHLSEMGQRRVQYILSENHFCPCQADWKNWIVATDVCSTLCSTSSELRRPVVVCLYHALQSSSVADDVPEKHAPCVP